MFQYDDRHLLYVLYSEANVLSCLDVLLCSAGQRAPQGDWRKLNLLQALHQPRLSATHTQGVPSVATRASPTQHLGCTDRPSCTHDLTSACLALGPFSSGSSRSLSLSAQGAWALRSLLTSG